MTINYKSIVHAEGCVSPERAAAAVWSVIGGRLNADNLSKEQRERLFQKAGFTPCIRLNLAEALLAKKDQLSFAVPLSVLIRTFGLDAELAAEADRHHRMFFGAINLRAADRIYREHGGKGHFIQQVRQLADHGGDNERKLLVVASLAYSYAQILGLDETRFSVCYFEDRQDPGHLGYEENGQVHVNIASDEWAHAFAKAIGTTAHETLHALHEKEAQDYASGLISKDNPRYHHAKAAFINFCSNEESEKTIAELRRNNEEYLEVSANFTAARFEQTAATARVSRNAVLTPEPHRGGSLRIPHRAHSKPMVA